MTTRVCKKCGREKDMDEFGKCKDNHRRRICNECKYRAEVARLKKTTLQGVEEQFNSSRAMEYISKIPINPEAV